MSRRDIEAIYPLSPTQQGIFLETLAGPGSTIHIEQVACTFCGDLDIAAFTAAWRDIVARHGILRTGFVWQDESEPVQFVRRDTALPLHRDDWRGQSDVEQRMRLDAYLDADRRRGFDLRQPPLMRIALFHIDERTFRFVWTFHHILMDGWCVPILVRELQALYAAHRRATAAGLAPVRPFRDYIAWLRKQDGAAAAFFWRRRLAGVLETPLGGYHQSTQADRYGRIESGVSGAVAGKLREYARAHRLTLNTIVQGAWAIVLAQHAAREDVVFGVTVSGRPAEIDGAERMIGPFFNTVPLRIAIEADAALADWLTGIQSGQIEQGKYEYCSSAQIHEWSGIAGGVRLYDSLLVFENLAQSSTAADASPPPAADLAVTEPTSNGARTNLALTLLVGAGTELHLSFVHDRARLSESDVRALADGLAYILTRMATAPVSIAALIADLAEVPRATVLRHAQPDRPPIVSARTSLELELTGIWESLLGVHPIGVHDNFFALGGHSLAVIKLMSAIERKLNRKLPISAIFEGPSIEHLALVLSRGSKAFSPLVPIRIDGAGAPLFCIHPLGGNVICYADFARAMGVGGPPIFGLQAPGMGEGEMPYRDFTSMADGYIAALRAMQPSGPYRLVGYSFGGMVAIVMARRLVAMDQQVGLVALLDTPNPNALADDVKYTDSAGLMVSLFSQALDVSLDHLRSLDETAQLGLMLEKAKAANLVPPEAGLAEAQRYFEVCKINHRMPYPADGYDGPVVLIRGEEGATRLTDDPALGWKDVLSDLSVRWVAGSHETMLSALHAGTVAAVVMDELAKDR